MEVLCERCQTEYDFDDALVSERGTTVKCTNCGHQFRIFRPKSVSASPERWVVRTSDGRDLVFTSLRDLQRAITRGQVGRQDTLTRGGLPTRALSSIAELEPFFPEAADEPTTVPRYDSERAQDATPRGLGPLDSRPPVPSIHREDEDDDFEEATIPRVSAGTDRNLPPAHDLLGEEPGFEPATQRRPESSQGMVAEVRPSEAGVRVPDKVVIREAPHGMTPTPSDVRASYGSIDDSITDPRFMSAPPPKRSAAARWVVGVVVLGALGVVAATVGRSYLAGAANPASSASAPDARVAGLLDEGKRHLREGDIEAAKASFDKASVLAENDVYVLRQLAALTNIKGDQAWLKLRLLEPGQTEVIRITQSELGTRGKQALAASERAWKPTPDEPEAVRIRVDALRLSGDLSGARSLVPKLAEHTSEADYAYVLAALEMCEKTPNWTTVVDRLRVATAGEQDLGRARAALIYALIRSGQVESAKTELQALDKLPRPYPLIVEMKAFFARMEKLAADGGLPTVGGADADVLDPTRLPAAATTVEPGGEGAPGDEVAAGSYQDLLKRAHAARRSGNYDEAERLYKSVLAKNPGDTEALAGLGDIAKARGDTSKSVNYYEEVNKQNPGYLPAMMGLADAKWDAGDRAGAVALYQQVISATSGQGPYAGRARQRIAEAAKQPEQPKADAAPPPEPTATATATATETPPPEPTKEPPPPAPTDTGKTSPPGVDTSDLPGWSP